MNVGPVVGLETLHSSCCVLFRGQATGVNQRKVYTQSSMAEMRIGLDSCIRKKPTDIQSEISRQMKFRGLLNQSRITHHFVTFKADDARAVAFTPWTGLAASVLEVQDTCLKRGAGLYVAQTHIFVSNLHTSCCTGRTCP